MYGVVLVAEWPLERDISLSRNVGTDRSSEFVGNTTSDK